MTDSVTTRPVPSPTDGRPAPARILLAEDEEHLGAILQAFLAGRGHEVTRVQDGAAAVASLRERSYDVALLDVMMPEMDGLEVLGALASLPVPPEAIVMTGHGTVDTAITAMRLGAYDYLAKPYRMAEVELLIGRAAEKRRLRLAAACTRWIDAHASRSFLTAEAGLRAALQGAARSVSEDIGRGWVIFGAAGSGRRTLARWLESSVPSLTPPLLVRASGDSSVDAAALFGTSGEVLQGQGDAMVGALEAAGGAGSLLILDDWERLEAPVRGRVAEALDVGGFHRGADASGAWVPLTGAGVHGGATRVCILAERDESLHAAFMESALRMDIPPLDARPMDIPLLADHLLRGASAGMAMLDEGAVEWLQARSWPRGVAELRDLLVAAAWRAARGSGWARNEAEPVILTAHELGATWSLPEGKGAVDQSHERRA